MSYQVQGIAYDTREEAMTALIAQWVSAGGTADKVDIEESLQDSDTARELMLGWGGDLGDDYATEGEILEHMANYYDDILAEAI